MIEWLRILDKAVTNGVSRPDRTGVGTLALFGEQLVFENTAYSFPAVTTKELKFGQVKAELAAFLRGYQTLDEFHSVGCKIWDGNGGSDYWKPRRRQEGDLGRIYGVQWRDWRSVGRDVPDPEYEAGELVEVRRTDQLAELVQGILGDPFGRRHVVTAWNPGELDAMCLPPCHVLFQVFLSPHSSVGVKEFRLDLRVDMRSVDLFLGLPFDVASYALLQRLLCNELERVSGGVYRSRRLVFQLGDAHVYLNHLDQVRTVLDREPEEPPSLFLEESASLFAFDPDGAKLFAYEHWGAVPAPLNV